MIQHLTSLPVWGEWIEIQPAHAAASASASLPVWGEWIEMGWGIGHYKPTGLSPCGESGLKWPEMRLVSCGLMSLPVWGEWIEIATAIGNARISMSLPVWGEWIEIDFLTAIVILQMIVSPRVGRVD